MLREIERVRPWQSISARAARFKMRAQGQERCQAQAAHYRPCTGFFLLSARQEKRCQQVSYLAAGR